MRTSKQQESESFMTVDVSLDPKTTQGGKQETLAGIDSPNMEKASPSSRTWGELGIQRLNLVALGSDGSVLNRPPKDGEPSMAFWMDLDVNFPSGSTKDAELFLENMLQDSESQGGRFQIIRRVKVIEARVETIRRVQIFDVDESSDGITNTPD